MGIFLLKYFFETNSTWQDFIIRVSDRGGGIPHDQVERSSMILHNPFWLEIGFKPAKKRTLTIWFLLTQVEKVLQYNYTTAEKSTDKMVEDSGIFGSMMEAVNRTSSGPMHGFGVGLPCSAAYSEYLGGELKIQSMQVEMSHNKFFL